MQLHDKHKTSHLYCDFSVKSRFCLMYSHSLLLRFWILRLARVVISGIWKWMVQVTWLTSVQWGCRRLWRCKTACFCGTAWTAASAPARSSPPAGKTPAEADSPEPPRPSGRNKPSEHEKAEKNEEKQGRGVRYLAGSVGVQHFVLDDEPQPLPLLLVAFGAVHVAAHGRVLCVGRNLQGRHDRDQTSGRHGHSRETQEGMQVK